MISNGPRRQRPIPVAWQSAPLDMHAQGFVAMLVMHIPIRREFNAQQRNAVAQAAADAALHAIQTLEDL